MLIWFAGWGRRRGRPGSSCPPFAHRRAAPEARRTIRRLPGGPVVAVVVRGRSSTRSFADMVDGVLAANGLAWRGVQPYTNNASAGGDRPGRARRLI